MKAFTLEPMDVTLPRGAFAGGGRDVLRYNTSPVCAFTRGKFRPCLHPVWSPSGHVVTAEQPADHPHHRGIWVASDHVGLMVPGPEGDERYDYNFYTDDVFQGRAPGRIVQKSLQLIAQSEDRALVKQSIDWIGPVEWGAENGRHVLTEHRWTSIIISDEAYVLDVTCDLAPASQFSVGLGPTRHALFNARIADTIAIDTESLPVDEQGRRGAAAIGSRGFLRVDYSGPVGGGAMAGISVEATSSPDNVWFVADWGVMTVGPIRDAICTLPVDGIHRFSCRFAVHDGDGSQYRAWSEIPFHFPEIYKTGRSSYENCTL